MQAVAGMVAASLWNGNQQLNVLSHAGARAVELLYNPDVMREEEIKATFVARHNLLEELISLIEHQPDGAGVQHVVIIAPRGMGKTTMLLMVQFAIRDCDLGERWQAIRFSEESYGVYDLADFWIEVLSRLAAETRDAQLLECIEGLKLQHPSSDDLQEGALALIKDWRRKHNKRIVLLVDNFDMILEQINDERDNALLRDVLMNDGTMMLIGGATFFFHEARAYDQPLYNFFKIYNLDDLKFAQIQDLLRRRAFADQQVNFEEKLTANEARIRVLEYFTGGNPRLVLMLYRVVTQSDITEVRRGLEKLLDEVTPYYKAKVEQLPAQQRKILDHIARMSSKTREGLQPSEIAVATRLKPNQVSAQLRRLAELGYVRAANLRERNSYYTLSEPLYAIWHQMRFGRDSRQRMQWLVNFLKVWYDASEIGAESTRLEIRFREHLNSGRLREARDAIEHRRYLAEAMDDLPASTNTLESVICSYMETKDFEILKNDLLTPNLLLNLSGQTLQALYESGCIDEEEFESSVSSSPVIQQHDPAPAIIASAQQALAEDRFDEALNLFGQALEIKPRSYISWFYRGWIFGKLGQYDEAVASFDHAINLAPEHHPAWSFRSIALYNSGKYQESIDSSDQALKINPTSANDWQIRGQALYNLGIYEEAINSFDNALRIKSDLTEIWFYYGRALFKAGKYKEAVNSFDRTLELDDDFSEAWVQRGRTFLKLQEFESSLRDFDRAIELDPNLDGAWFYRAVTLSKLGRHQEAITSFDQVLKIRPDSSEAWNNRGGVLLSMGRYEEAVSDFNRAVSIDPDYAEAWHNRGNAFFFMGRHEEAVSDFNRAVSIDPDYVEASHERGGSLYLVEVDLESKATKTITPVEANDARVWAGRGFMFNKAGKYEEALASYAHARELDPSNVDLSVTCADMLIKLGKPEEALTYCNQVLESKSNHPRAWQIRGIALFELGDRAEAFTSFSNAVELAPNDHISWANYGAILINIGEYDEAIESLDRALNIKVDYDEAWRTRGAAYLNKFLSTVARNAIHSSHQYWNEAVDSLEKIKEKEKFSMLSHALVEVAKLGHLKLARQLIRQANLEEQVFPLTRALDYLITGNAVLIEKLSPEFRSIIDEIVSKLNKATD